MTTITIQFDTKANPSFAVDLIQKGVISKSELLSELKKNIAGEVLVSMVGFKSVGDGMAQDVTATRDADSIQVTKSAPYRTI